MHQITKTQSKSADYSLGASEMRDLRNPAKPLQQNHLNLDENPFILENPEEVVYHNFSFTLQWKTHIIPENTKIS